MLIQHRERSKRKYLMIQELAQLKTQIQKNRNEVSEASCKIFYFIDSYWKYFFSEKNIFMFLNQKEKVNHLERNMTYYLEGESAMSRTLN